MNIIYALLISTFAGLSTLIGTLPIFFNINKSIFNKFISISLSFSISIMIGISILDLVPNSFFTLLFRYNLLYSLFISILSIIIGSITVFIINKLIKFETNSLYKMGILSMIAIILHNLPEGIATFFGSVNSPTLGIKLSIAIILHNIPEGISISIPIYYATKSKRKAIIYTLISALAEPFGAIIAYLFLFKYISNISLGIILLFVAGIMITLSIHEILPKVTKYKEYKYMYFGFIIGIIIVLLNHLLF